MNILWIPSIFTLVILAATYADLRGKVSANCKSTEDWILLGLALLVKPGLFLAIVWAMFLVAF